MDFKGKVLDGFGQPLWGAHVITVFRDRNIGVTTDKDGYFTIPEEQRRTDETWKISFIGFGDVFFNIPKYKNNENFSLEEKTNDLEGVVVTAGNPNTKVQQPHYSPVALDNIQITATNPNSINKDLAAMSRPKDTGTRTFWDNLKENKGLLAGIGIAGALIGLALFRDNGTTVKGT